MSYQTISAAIRAHAGEMWPPIARTSSGRPNDGNGRGSAVPTVAS